MNKLLQDSWDLLKKNPYLYTPPALLLILSGLVDPGGASISSFFIVSIMTFLFINMAITAGWLNEIKVVIASKEQKAAFEDVLVGIGKYFPVILVGGFILFTLIITLFSIYITVANSLIGMNETHIASFQKIWTTIQSLKREQVEDYVTKIDPSLMIMAYKWAFALLFYAGITGVFYFFISLWTQCCVFRGLSWFQGWKRSFKLVKKNLGIYTLLTLIESAFIVAIFLLTLFLPDPFTRILLTIINIITKTYFTVLFCLFIVRYDDDTRIELLKDEVQSPLSEIPGPDNKK